MDGLLWLNISLVRVQDNESNKHQNGRPSVGTAAPESCMYECVRVCYFSPLRALFNGAILDVILFFGISPPPSCDLHKVPDHL